MILAGEPEDDHWTFAQRFVAHDLRRYLDGKETPSCVHVPWPEGGLDVRSILSLLEDHLPLPRHDSVEKFVATLATRSRPILFHTIIHHDVWERDRGRLLNEWIDFYCKQWPSSTQTVICFVSICFPAHAAGAFSLKSVIRHPRSLLTAIMHPRLLMSFIGLRKRAQHEPRLLVADPFEKIEEWHVDQWMLEIEPRLHDPRAGSAVVEQVKPAFNTRRRCPFKPISRQLRDALSSQAGDWSSKVVVQRWNS